MKVLASHVNHIINRISSLNDRQRGYFELMLTKIRMTLCIPTGAGKGYIMITHLMDRIINSKEDIFLTLSHRLTLNTQHLNDIVESLDPMLGNIGFIFVGSSKYINIYEKLNNTDNILLNNTEIALKIKFNKLCLLNRINMSELFTNTLNSNDLKIAIDRHRIANRKIVIISTYHSANIFASLDVPIDVVYCDEAHTLATDYFGEDINFYTSFNKIKSHKYIFLTATPKDCDDESVAAQSALMNNISIYGERFGMSFKEAIEDGYVVLPVIHTATPVDGLVDKLINLKSVSKFVCDVYQSHHDWVKDVSVSPDDIGAKLLIKCESVKMMWRIAKELVGIMPDVTICCGASDTEYDIDNTPIGSTHRIDNYYISKREEYLDRLQNLGSTENAIVLHFDTLSEGINVSGFTGIMFLTDNLPSKPKLLQNAGRGTRLHPKDRAGLRAGLIKVREYGTWVKPHCAIIIPYWTSAGDRVKQTIAEVIINLREEYGFKSGTDHGLGNALGKGSERTTDDRLNVTKYYKDGKIDLCDNDLEQIIEDLYIDVKNKQKSDNLDKLSPEEWLKHNFG